MATFSAGENKESAGVLRARQRKGRNSVTFGGGRDNYLIVFWKGQEKRH